MDYDIFGKGISGYAPQGSNGQDGSNGYNIYYSAYSYADGSAYIRSQIIDGKELSNNSNISVDVDYKVNDMIVCSDSVVLIIKSITSTTATIERMGSLIYKEKTQTITKSTSLPSSVTFYMTATTSANDYNYCIHTDPSTYTIGDKSPLYHHRSAYVGTFTGIRLYTKYGYIKGTDAKICILFNNGMSFSAPCTASGEVDSFFIDNSYFVSYGKWSDRSYWGAWDSSNMTQSEEYISGAFTNQCKNLMYQGSSGLCIVNAYIETSVIDNTSNSVKTMYRIPITISNS